MRSTTIATYPLLDDTRSCDDYGHYYNQQQQRQQSEQDQRSQQEQQLAATATDNHLSPSPNDSGRCQMMTITVRSSSRSRSSIKAAGPKCSFTGGRATTPCIVTMSTPLVASENEKLVSRYRRVQKESELATQVRTPYVHQPTVDGLTQQTMGFSPTPLD